MSLQWNLILKTRIIILTSLGTNYDELNNWWKHLSTTICSEVFFTIQGISAGSLLQRLLSKRCAVDTRKQNTVWSGRRRTLYKSSGMPSVLLAVFKITIIYYILSICTKCWQFYIKTTRIADCRDRASFLKHSTFLDSSLSHMGLPPHFKEIKHILVLSLC